MPPEGYTFEGYQNLDGSVGTRNILAIAECLNRARSDLCGACAAIAHPYRDMDRSGWPGGLRTAAAEPRR